MFLAMCHRPLFFRHWKSSSLTSLRVLKCETNALCALATANLLMKAGTPEWKQTRIIFLLALRSRISAAIRGFERFVIGLSHTP